MAGVYRPRHPERTVLYRVLFHHFDRFLAEYESRFEREYGFFRPVLKEVVEGHHEAPRAVVIFYDDVMQTIFLFLFFLCLLLLGLITNLLSVPCLHTL